MKKNLTRFVNAVHHHNRSLIIVAILFMWNTSVAQIQLIKDINQQEDPYYTDFGLTVAVDDNLFFYSPGGLYFSDGTTAGTSFVASFRNIGEGTSFNHTFVFSGDDGTGLALWRSDGTAAGTFKIKHVAPNSASYYPQHRARTFTAVNGTLFFAGDDGVSGVELWKTDGTTAGTVRVKDIIAGSTSSNPSWLASVNGKLFFAAPSGNSRGVELWASDGTTAGTAVVKDIFPGSRSSDPSQMVNVNGVCFFIAKDGVNGIELWKSDGTAAGTTIVKDIRPGSANASVSKLTPVNNVLFFEAHDGVHGKELWKSDGSVAGTVLVKDITPGPASDAGFAIEHLNHFFAHNGILYFVAFHKGHRLWRSDGTSAGTFPLSGGEGGFAFLYPEICTYNNQIYFLTQNDFDYTSLNKTDGTIGGTSTVIEYFANFDYGTFAQLKPSSNRFFVIGQDYLSTESFGGTELMLSDGTEAGTQTIFDGVDANLSSEPRSFTKVGNKLFFVANESDNYFDNLWTTDGTTAGTLRAREMWRVHDGISYQDKLLFGGTADYYGFEGVWVSDGTEAGTYEVAPVDMGFPSILNDEVLFSGNNGAGWQLWKTDGTGSGTSLLKTINPSGSGYPQYLTTIGNQVLFRATDDTNDSELWTSDGTAAGTFRLRNINPSGSSNLLYFRRAGDRIFFIADDGTTGSELWVSDGTVAGTLLTRDIAPGSSTVDNITALGNNVLFTALDQYGSNGLWFSDGTTAGTYALKDFFPGNETIDVFGVNETYALIVVTDPANQYSELWKSDGTTAGTVQLRDFGRFAGYLDYGASLNDVFYFTLAYGESSLWRTDGTECGTYRIEYPNPIGVSAVAVINGKVVFNAGTSEAPNFSNYGAELYGYSPEAPLPCATAARVATAEEIPAVFGAYPNPSKHQFVVNVPGQENEKYSMQIMNLNGRTIESTREYECNRDYTFGNQWASGVYVLKAIVNGKMITSKLVKTQ